MCACCYVTEKYFDMNKKQCREALDLYKKFLIRMDRVAEFLKVAEVKLKKFIINLRIFYCCEISVLNYNMPNVSYLLVSECWDRQGRYSGPHQGKILSDHRLNDF